MLSIASSALAAFMAWWIALLFHELAHTAAAEAVGVRIWRVRLGMGPTIWRRTVNGRQLHVCLLPFAGGVTLLDEDADTIGYRDIVSGRWRFEWGPDAWRAPIISASGGLSNFLGMLLFLTAWQAAGHPGVGDFTGSLLLFGIAANMGGYLNLVPCSHSDGRHLAAHLSAVRAGVPSRAQG
jgi:membrane-associated protease RseP (regulator of RpoE activity)